MHAALLAVLSLVVPCVPGAAHDGQGSQVIRATGIGRPPHGRSPAQARLLARRAAEVVALRNLAAKLEAHDRAAPEGPPATGTFRRTSLAHLRGFRYLPPRYLPDGRVEVTVELPLPLRPRSGRAGAHVSGVPFSAAHAEYKDVRAVRRAETRPADTAWPAPKPTPSDHLDPAGYRSSPASPFAARTASRPVLSEEEWVFIAF
jgi:hypothetical protein